MRQRCCIALASEERDVKRKTGCASPKARNTPHSALCCMRKTGPNSQMTASVARDAVSRCRAPLDIGHGASRAERDASGALRDTGGAGHLARARRRAAGRTKRGPKDTLHGPEGLGRVALSALRAAFDKRRQIGLCGRFSTLSTSPWCLLRLCWEKAGLYEVGKK